MNNPFDESLDSFKALLSDAKTEPKTNIDKELIDAEVTEINDPHKPDMISKDEPPFVGEGDNITEEIESITPESSSKEPTDDNPLISQIGIKPTQYKDAVKLSEELATVETKQEVQKTFNSLYNDLNKKYGLQLNMDANSFSELMRGISDPKMKEAMNLYTSEAFSRFRALLYNRYMTSLAMLSEKILDPAYILSDNVPYEEKLSLMERLFKFMAAIEQIYSTVNIENSDIKLSHLSDNNNAAVDLNDAGTRELLAKLLGQGT